MKKAKKNQNTPKKHLRKLLFIFICAIFFRWLIAEAYTIPSASMENTLWCGDFILVGKWQYGARTPSTWLQLPLTFRKIWFTDWDSYWDIPEARLPVTRLPAYSVQRNDLVVFNYPKELQYPIELRTPYIKRCVAIAGDTLAILASKIYVNSYPLPAIPARQYKYFIRNKDTIPTKVFAECTIKKFTAIKVHSGFGYMLTATPKAIERLEKRLTLLDVIPQSQPKDQIQSDIFPQNPHVTWNEDNFSPLIIPRKGMTLPMSVHNVHVYGALIKTHEIYGKKKKVWIKNDTLYINGQKITDYTFQQNYFFMMGDNFHDSEDSRFFGFVPQDHLIGKAFFIWLSFSQKGHVRWNRIGWIK